MELQSNTAIPEKNISKPETPGFFRRHSRSIWLSLITVALAVAALLVYIIFFRNTGGEVAYSGDVKLEISAPAESVSGSEISFRINVNNLSSAKLTRVNLEIFYPQGFTFLRATGESNDSGRTVTLEDLPRGEQQALVIVGTLTGHVQEIKTLNAKLHYVPENFNSFFLASASVAVVILPPEISMRILAPGNIISGQIIKYQIEVSNVSQQSFDNLLLELSYPPDFSYVGASPAPAGFGNQSTWIFANLLPGASQTVDVQGRLNTAPNEDVYLVAELYTASQDKKLSAGRSYAFTRVLDSPLKMTLDLEGGVGTVFGGEGLTYNITYENVGEVGLSNVTLVLKFDTSVFDLAGAKGESGQIRGSEMVWLPAAVPELGFVRPGQRGRFSAEVPLRAEKSLTQKNPVAKTLMQFFADELSEPIAGASVSAKLGTNLSLFSEISLISGPKEPEPGQQSVYLVTLILKNSVNDVEKAELTARVPLTTAVLDMDSLVPEDERGNVEYVRSAGILRWRLGKVFAYSGTVHSPRTISLRIAVTPEPGQSGKAVLLQDAEAAGRDVFTGEDIFSNKIESVETR